MTPAGLDFARSQKTLGDLTRYAGSAPLEAQQYLQQVKTALASSPLNAPVVQSLEQLLTGAGDLTERIAARSNELAPLFKSDAVAMGETQTARAVTLGWEAAPAQNTVSLKGTVRLENDGLLFDVPGMRSLSLAEGNSDDSVWGIPAQWMHGLMGDGPMQLTGTLGSDGTSFNVEGFALNRDGRYDQFVFARVSTETGELFLKTPKGQRIDVTSGGLRQQFSQMNKLAVILPGGAEALPGGKLQYTGNPEKFFALARFESQTLNGRTASMNMAHEAFMAKPVRLPEGAEARVNHGYRVWVEGKFESGSPGEKPVGFDAAYLGINADSMNLHDWKPPRMPPKVTEANALEAARELTAAS